MKFAHIRLHFMMNSRFNNCSFKILIDGKIIFSSSRIFILLNTIVEMLHLILIDQNYTTVCIIWTNFECNNKAVDSIVQEKLYG